MSQDFLDPELITDFILESKEHLETIEPNLLELEKAPDNLALLNEIFRPMHSLKGASGFLGLNRINHLAHKSENILDELRKGVMVVTPEIMDVILASTDALRQMIDNLDKIHAEGDVPTEHIIQLIETLLSGGTLPAGAARAAVHGEEIPGLAEPVQQIADAPLEPIAPVEPVEPVEPVASASQADTLAASAEKERSTLSTRDWISTLPVRETVPLVAFGASHLKDFMDEARENTENLNTGLLELERNPTGNAELVNDLFRFFHNLKGNSGIIDYKELNSLTHEAETLLNRVRHDELVVTHELVDLLLVVVDALDALVDAIDPASGTATPFDSSELLTQLQKAVAGGEISLPESLLVSPAVQEAPVTAKAKPQDSTITPIGADRDEDDLAMYKNTVHQQRVIMVASLEEIKKDPARKEEMDAVFRSLMAIANASSFMGFAEIKSYAERTAGIVDQARKTDMDLSCMVDLLDQEIAIVCDMAQASVQVPEQEAAAVPAPKEEAPATAQVASPTPAAPATPSVQAAPTPKAETPQQAPAAPATPPAPKPAATPATAGAAAPAAGNAPEKAASSSIRVDHEKLDHLMNLIGELLINRNRYAMITKTLEAGANVDVTAVAQDLSETTYAMARVSDELQDTIMKVRMVPVSSVFSRFPRLVRDLSRKSGKEVELVMEGEETELDKSVVEVINDPLMHLIRNSVDHGIEPEDVRIAKGKNPKGRVTLRAYHKGNSVAIEIEDDGAGIDPDKMREVAIRKGIITPDEAKNMDDREAVDLIFAPGFSSAEKITDISGRGVGMDVVRTNVKNLKGSVNTSTELGKGTRFTLSLPLTLAIIEALMIKMNDQMYAIPLDAVSTTTKLESVRLTNVKGRKAVTMRGEVLGIVQLAELLNLPHEKELPEVLSVVIIQDNERHLGLVVDRLLDRQEIVIKSLGTYLGDVKGLSGASIMGDGSVVLILDPHEVYMMATSKAI